MWWLLPRQRSGTHTPIPGSMHHAPRTTHLHRAAARTCMLRSRSDHCLSPPCLTTPQRPVSRLTIPSYPICAEPVTQCCVLLVALHGHSRAGRLCRAEGHQPSKRKASDHKASAVVLGPGLLPGHSSQDKVCVRIIPTVGINAANSATRGSACAFPNMGERWSVFPQQAALTGWLTEVTD